MLARSSSLTGGLATLQPVQMELWDPGRYTCIPNRVFATIATAAVIKEYKNEMSIDKEDLGCTRMELDSHASWTGCRTSLQGMDNQA